MINDLSIININNTDNSNDPETEAKMQNIQKMLKYVIIIKYEIIICRMMAFREYIF